MRRGINQQLVYLISAITFSILYALLASTSTAFAQFGCQEAHTIPGFLPNQTSYQPVVGNDVCLDCHGEPGLTLTLPSGDILDLYVNPDNYATSVHGKNGYACVQCHTD